MNILGTIIAAAMNHDVSTTSLFILLGVIVIVIISFVLTIIRTKKNGRDAGNNPYNLFIGTNEQNRRSSLVRSKHPDGGNGMHNAIF